MTKITEKYVNKSKIVSGQHNLGHTTSIEHKSSFQSSLHSMQTSIHMYEQSREL
jgi:hypothetical protein